MQLCLGNYQGTDGDGRVSTITKGTMYTTASVDRVYDGMGRGIQGSLVLSLQNSYPIKP